ncbi:MAG: hypothetical protein OJJ54_14745 [Pseudonocardia sp.]|nr:hypothetical protein [Pseudonocardia sp.]
MNRARPGSLLTWCMSLAVLVASLTACGSPRPEPAASAGLRKVYDVRELLDAVTARQRTDRTATLQVAGHVDDGTSASVGPTAEPAMTVGGTGALRIEDSGVSVDFTQTLTHSGEAPQSTGFVVLPGQVFLRLPSARSGDPRPWTKVDAASRDTTERTLATLATNVVNTADPTANISRFVDASLIADASDDNVDGIPAVRYTIVVDLNRAAELERDPAVRAQLQQQVAGGLTRISSTLWIDEEHHPVRSEAKQDMPGIGTLAMTADYRSWGTPVLITAPPAEQVR